MSSDACEGVERSVIFPRSRRQGRTYANRFAPLRSQTRLRAPRVSRDRSPPGPRECRADAGEEGGAERNRGVRKLVGRSARFGAGVAATESAPPLGALRGLQPAGPDTGRGNRIEDNVGPLSPWANHFGGIAQNVLPRGETFDVSDESGDVWIQTSWRSKSDTTSESGRTWRMRIVISQEAIEDYVTSSPVERRSADLRFANWLKQCLAEFKASTVWTRGEAPDTWTITTRELNG